MHSAASQRARSPKTMNEGADKVNAFRSFVILSCLLMSGCEGQVTMTKAIPAEQHTGPVTVTDISVGYCLPTVGEKSGTSVCDRTLTLKSDTGAIYQLGLERSGAWPPVWKGMKADIHFKECENCYPKASTILWIQELQEREPKIGKLDE